MWTPATYLSEESASSNCPGTTATILSRLQSMTSGAEETAFHPANPTVASPRLPPHTNRSAIARRKAASMRHGVSGYTTSANTNTDRPEVQCRKCVTRSSAPCRSARPAHVRYGGRERPIRDAMWGCGVDCRTGRAGSVLPQPFIIALTCCFPPQKVRPVIPRLLLKTCVR